MREIWVVGEDRVGLLERIFAAFVKESELPCAWKRDMKADDVQTALRHVQASTLPGLLVLHKDVALSDGALLLKWFAASAPYKLIPRVIVTREDAPIHQSDDIYALGVSGIVQFPIENDTSAIDIFVQYWTRTTLLPLVSAPTTTPSN